VLILSDATIRPVAMVPLPAVFLVVMWIVSLFFVTGDDGNRSMFGARARFLANRRLSDSPSERKGGRGQSPGAAGGKMGGGQSKIVAI
jgi:hypothetical protein